jgi:Domain of unknown function (DUF4157)
VYDKWHRYGGSIGSGSGSAAPSSAIPGKRTLIEQLVQRRPTPSAMMQATPVAANALMGLSAASTEGDGIDPFGVHLHEDVVQARADGPLTADPEQVHQLAAAGVAGTGGPLPHAETIAASFGADHAATVHGISAHVGGKASEAAGAIGAQAYATGSSVAFAGAPTLHTAAHEAAHVVQQVGGVQLKGGVGEAGDAYEVHADAVADRVVAGESAADLLSKSSSTESTPTSVQRQAAPAQHAPPAPTINMPHAPEANPGAEQRSYIRDGALCNGPAVGICTLDGGVRSRLLEIYFAMLGACRSAFLSGCSMAYTDVKLEPDTQLPWYVDLAITTAGYALGDAINKALGRAAKWAAGAQPAAYARLFEGESVSKTQLAFYGAVAKVPFGSLQPLVRSAVQKGSKGASAALAGKNHDAQAAGLVLIKVCIAQGNELFNHFLMNVPGQVDDAKLFALMDMFADPDAQDPTVYKDNIVSRLGELRSYEIGRHVDADNAGGHVWQRAAVYVSDGKAERLGLLEHDGARFRMSKGDQVHEIDGEHRKWIGWIDDSTMAAAAEGLTRARGNGNILRVDRETAEQRFEGFAW